MRQHLHLKEKKSLNRRRILKLEQWEVDRIILLFYSISELPALILDLEEKEREEFITQSMILTIITFGLVILLLSMELLWLRLQAERFCVLLMMKFSGRVSTYLNQIEKLTKNMRDETNQLNLELKDKMFTEVADPTKTYIPPKSEDPVPYLNFAPLENAVNALQKSANEYQKAKNEFDKSGKTLSNDQQKNLDQLIYRSERFLTNKEGLTGRPWYVHEIYAPGFYTGYGVKTLPAVREAVESRNWDEANKQAVVVANTLNNYSKEIDKATEMLKAAKE